MEDLTILHDELISQHIYASSKQENKDIIVVVHDQLEFVERCVKSLYANTENFTLYLWDNGSMQPTREYLEKIEAENDNVVLVRKSENIGFIVPNNELAAMGISPYIILLNDDTEVYDGWDTALIGWLKNHENCKVTGFQGGTLDPTGKGSGIPAYGFNIDYVCGWCLCIGRDTFDEFGLFDEKNLSFAYGEDSDFSLRIKEKGFQIYALNMRLVFHFGNMTVFEVQRETDTSASFEKNHLYIKSDGQTI